MSDAAKVQLIIGFFGLLTVLVAWVFRYRIAALGKGKSSTPQEVLFDGYERLLKRYQLADAEKDKKIGKLEQALDVVQEDLAEARRIAGDLRYNNEQKDQIIKEMKEEIQDLRLKLTAPPVS